MSGWVNEGVPLTVAWTTGAAPTVTLPNGDTSDRLRKTGVSGLTAGDHVLRYSFTSDKANFLTARVRFEKAGVEVGQLLPDTHGADPILIAVAVGTNTGSVNIRLSDVPDEVSFMVFDAGAPGDAHITLNYLDIDLSSATDTQVISEPAGWRNSVLKMKRHPTFHSLVEYFEGTFMFYGENNIDNGGIDFIKQIESAFGFDAEIQILVEADIDGDGVYEETIFLGQLDLTEAKEMIDNRMQVPIMPSDFWTKFIVRQEAPINLAANSDLDGNAIETAAPVDIEMPSQRIQKLYQGHYKYAYTVGQPESEGYEYYLPDFEIEDRDEIDGKVTLDRVLTDVLAPIFHMEESGFYTFDIKLTLGHSAPIDANFSYSTLGKYIPKIKINDDAAVVFTGTDVTYGSDVVTEWTYSNTIELQRLDRVTLYVEDVFNFSTDRLYIFGEDGFEGSGAFRYGESYMNVTGNTTHPASATEGWLLHDAAHNIIKSITSGSLYSEYFGSAATNARQYASDGCGWKNVLVQGLQIRGYTLAEKQFAMSFKKWWEGANPLFNLGLGYTSVANEIEIEPVEDFFDATDISVYFENVRELSREYDHDMIYNQLEFGFNKWQSEDLAGLDDPQTKRTWTTCIRKIKNALTQYSEFIAAGIATEVTRRKTIEKKEDYKYDNEPFIIAVKDAQVSPDRFAPELDENFDSITGLLNSETRYNSIHTPLRMLLRWANWWNSCLQKYQTSSLKFASGEGNYDMVSEYDCASGEDQCLAVLCDNLSEKQDVNLTTYGPTLGYLHLPLLYTIEIINFTWDDYLAIRNNRKKAIGISQTDGNFKRFFIKDLNYDVCKGKCKVVAWPYDETPITIVETGMPERGRMLMEGGDDILMETGDQILIE